MIRLSRLLVTDRKIGGTGQTTSDNLCTAEKLMNSGDELRAGLKYNGALAALGIASIWSQRNKQRIPQDQSSRHVWILRTLKHEKEVELLRHVYGSRFILVGAQQDEATRMTKLCGDLRDERPTDPDIQGLAMRLITRDQMDSENESGQHVRDTYSLSDYFINVNADIENETSRLVGLLFGKPFVTPTRDEQGMFHAYAAAFRSSDPGRQVGAAVTTPAGEIIVTGTNEVPRAGGGNYWEGDDGDSRDFRLGYNFNKRITNRAMREFVSYLARRNMLSPELQVLSLDEQCRRIMNANRGDLKKLRFNSLIEFGRISHAEMSAITQAARTSSSTQDGTLYTTTFPCHMCMRLIIGSGIRRVVYVDPYSKSLASEMYPDSLARPGGVEVSPFWGASWTVFPRLFERINREEFLSGEYNGLNARMRLAGHDPLSGAVAREMEVHQALRLNVNANLKPKRGGQRFDEGQIRSSGH